LTYLEFKETEARLKSQKAHNIKHFLEITNSVIEFDGEIYFIYREQILLSTFTDTDGIHSFVLGWLNSNEESSNEIKDLTIANNTLAEQNNNNIKMYEKLIRDMSGDDLIYGKPESKTKKVSPPTKE